MSTALTIQLSPDITYSCSLEIERPANDGEGTVWQSAPIVTKGLERGESPDRHAHGWVCAEEGRRYRLRVTSTVKQRSKAPYPAINCDILVDGRDVANVLHQRETRDKQESIVSSFKDAHDGTSRIWVFAKPHVTEAAVNNPLESKLGTIAVEFKRLKWTKRLYRDSEDEIESDSASDESTSPSPNLTDGQEQSGNSSKKRACPREKVLVNEKSKKAAISSVTLMPEVKYGSRNATSASSAARASVTGGSSSSRASKSKKRKARKKRVHRSIYNRTDVKSPARLTLHYATEAYLKAIGVVSQKDHDELESEAVEDRDQLDVKPDLGLRPIGQVAQRESSSHNQGNLSARPRSPETRPAIQPTVRPNRELATQLEEEIRSTEARLADLEKMESLRARLAELKQQKAGLVAQDSARSLQVIPGGASVKREHSSETRESTKRSRSSTIQNTASGKTAAEAIELD